MASSSGSRTSRSSLRYSDVERRRSAKPSPSNHWTVGYHRTIVGPNKPPGSLTSPQPSSWRAPRPRAADDPSRGCRERSARGDRRSRRTPPARPAGGRRRCRAVPSILRDAARRALAASRSTGRPSATTTRPRGRRSVDRGRPTPRTSTSRPRRCRKAASRWRASAAMPAPGSTAVTEHPSAASERVAWPVPQPTSSTDDRSSMPVMATRSANSSSGYAGRTRS